MTKRESVPADYTEAMACYAAGEYEQAAARLEGVIGVAGLPGHLARFYHGHACRRAAQRRAATGDLDGAAEWLGRGLRTSPHSPSLLRFFADVCTRQHRYADAAPHWGLLAAIHGHDARLRFKEAFSHFLAGRATKAIEILESIAQSHPSSFEALFHLGTILAAAEHYDRAVVYLTKACQLRPENVDVHWKLGLAQGARGHLAEAVRHLQQAHRIEPDSNWLLCHLALAVKQARHQGLCVTMDVVRVEEIADGVDGAVDRLGDLIVRDPEFIAAFLDLPQSQIDEHIFSSLLAILMRALERHPEYADLHYHCSNIHQRLGRTDEAIRECEHALEINPRYVNALIQLAKLYAQTNRDAAAIQRLRQAIRHGARFADVHYLLGKLYQRQGNVDNARRHYRRALKINRNFQAAHAALAGLAA